MRTLLAVLILVCFLNSANGIAQTTTVTSGIFLTSKEYKRNRLIEEEDCKNPEQIFKRNDLFSRQEFVVIKKGRKLTFLKKDIYAYRDCENRVWRFYNDKAYQIMESRALYIYNVKRTVLDGAIIDKNPLYYFSRGSDGEIMELNLENIKKTFPDNFVFLNMVTIELSADKAMEEFDAEHKMYKINFIYKQSIK